MPAPNVKFADIVMYLEAIADKGKRDAGGANHDRFWNGVTRDQFVAGTVPNEDCNGAPIPIVNSDPAQCALFQVLVNTPVGWCNKGQMPRGGGPWITDAGYQVTLSNAQVITGADIRTNLEWWLRNGMPA